MIEVFVRPVETFSRAASEMPDPADRFPESFPFIEC